ncbi:MULTISPECIES: MFS transporter [unclassified Beijerinckia]|uniref:MFS transporter n=1 Tax=unclassified Beijerinckia TaxID=2638183 RepID=UPI00089CE1B6|nr:MULTISPECIES: MFS transporter [unclassified Beijerinckia]MDH7794669.1 DHA2 family methylenomycin A resistance protein-like MFS transporter [Beijerinckia sp. GAS462]SEB70578.1 MFS transporter, DHA2 family, methylenomycin A resistance protein [Beijerinckia sp. 28-YEA-48]
MSPSPASRSRLTLIGAALGFVVVVVDVSVVNVALDAFRADFSTNVAGLEWVVNAYTLIFAALLLTTGTLGDRFGARKVFVAGFVLFTAASVACGLAPTLMTLVMARLVQGAGAALLIPNSLSLVQQAFPVEATRHRAVGWWSAAGGSALAAGPVIGGFLVAHFGWRSIFLINLPIGLIGLAITLRYAPRSPVNARRSLDLPGQGTAIIALAALATALIEAGHLGWTNPTIIIALSVAVIATVAFIAIEARTTEPMLPLTLFQSRAFTIASISGAFLNFAYYGLIFVFSLYFQWQQKFSPQETGLAFLPMTIVLMIANIASGLLITRLGARRLMVLGQMLAASGYLLLLGAVTTGSYALLIVPMLMAAGGLALVVPTITNMTLSAVEPSRAGLASGVLNTARQVGGMLGVAVCGYLVRDISEHAFMDGMLLSLALAVILFLSGALLSLLWLDRAASKDMPHGTKQEANADRSCPA